MDVTAVDPALQPAQPAAPPIEGKGFLPRAGAYIIDTLILYALTFATSWGMGLFLSMVLYLVSVVLGVGYQFSEVDTTCASYIIGFIQVTVYFTLFEWLYGRTPGKLILGMRVISSDGGSCSFKQAFQRALYRLIDGLIFGAVAYSNMKPPENQRLGDKRIGTRVVSAREAAIRERPAWWWAVAALALYLLLDGLLLGLLMLMQIRFFGA